MILSYTLDIPSGISFEEYAMCCATEFVPKLLMPKDKDRYLKDANIARDQLIVLKNMTTSECDCEARKEFEKFETERIESLKEMRKRRKAYEAMLGKVNAWTPPTPEHFELHKLMRSQIEKIIEIENVQNYKINPNPRLTGEQWREKEADRLSQSIEWNHKQYSFLVKQMFAFLLTKRGDWVRLLWNSLT